MVGSIDPRRGAVVRSRRRLIAPKGIGSSPQNASRPRSTQPINRVAESHPVQMADSTRRNKRGDASNRSSSRLMDRFNHFPFFLLLHSWEKLFEFVLVNNDWNFFFFSWKIGEKLCRMFMLVFNCLFLGRESKS